MKTIPICDDSQSLSAILTATNALGYLQPLAGTVTEELNGSYEAELTVSTEEPRFDELHVGGILKLPVNEEGEMQMFRIYEIGIPINSRATVKACHISYDLNKIAVKPFSATGAQNAVTGLMNNALNLGDFTMTTDLTNTASAFTLDIPRYFRECLGGYQGSMLYVFHGEYEWDNLTVKMLTERGEDNGVRVAYGKNIIDYRQEENNENVYTSVLGYAVVDGTTYTGNIYHKVASSDPKIKIVDFSQDYQSGGTPTVSELTAKAQTYANSNDIEVPKVNLSVNFASLQPLFTRFQTMEMIHLGDTVHVDISKLGVTATARVVKTVYDITKNRYESLELGTLKSNLSNVIDQTVSSAIETYDHSFEGVTGVKGDAETDYRTGNVNLTPQNLGISIVPSYISITGGETATFTMASSKISNISVFFIKRYSNGQTGGIAIIDFWSNSVTVLGTLDRISITKSASSRSVTITNNGTGYTPIIALGGTFS